MKNKEYNANLVPVKCKCGHTINFLKNTKVICTWCGRVVYADEKTRFKEIIKKTIKKIELTNEK